MIAIGIDIGGTFIKTAVLDNMGKVLHQKNSAHFAKTPIELIKKTAAILNNLKKIYKDKKTVACVAIAGIIDSKKGRIIYSPNLNKWKNINFLKTLEKFTNIETFVENDSNMSAWGAYAYELKKKYKNIINITLGTGLGAGIIANGKLYRGATLSAGEIGHIKINLANAPFCSCGERGCLESYTGSYALLAQAKKLVSDFRGKTILTKKNISAENLNLAAQRGDTVALKVWKHLGFYLGTGIANAVLILNPDVVVMSGGIVKAHKFFMPELKKILKNRKIETPFKKLSVKISKNSNLGAIGASLYATHKSK